MGRGLAYSKGIPYGRGDGVVVLQVDLDNLPKPMDIYQIARICHEANKAFCDSIGDYTHENWEYAPDWQRQSAVQGVIFNLQDTVIKPEESHKNWMACKLADGWTYGTIKDPEKKTHPCLVPYNELPLEQQIKDHIFASIVQACRPFVRKPHEIKT